MSSYIHTLSSYFKEEFGCRIFKISIDGGFTCPNRDGKIGRGGCAYCDPSAYLPESADRSLSTLDQFELGVSRALKRKKADKFLPYLQAYTSTYGDIGTLRDMYFSLMDHPSSIGLAVSTRPDELGSEVVNLLCECNERGFLWVEVGVQTLDDGLLQFMGRGHDSAASLRAIENLSYCGIRTVAHIIVGLPGEDEEGMLRTVKGVVNAGVFGIKFHPLHITSGCAWASSYRAGKIRLMERREYIGTLVTLLENTPWDVVIHRLTADAPASKLLGPEWLLDKSGVLSDIDAEFCRRKSRQGALVT